jgi:uncharacterized protein (TIGR02611 family)
MRGAKRLFFEAAGWVMLLGGLAAIPLPGPGLLITFAGLVLLSREYAWAERRVGWVRSRALDGAAQSVATWPRLAVSIGAAVLLLAAGVAWIVSPPPPTWWPLAETWWLPGGAVVGASQLASAVIALALLGYSYGRFRARPETSTPIAIVGADQPTPAGSPVLRPGAVRRDNMKGERCEVPCQCLCTSAA